MDFDRAKYKAFKLPHPLLVHWVLNPGLAFNELILGQRIPKIAFIDKTSDAPLMERQYVPCPHCGTIHNSSLWAKERAFENWFGLFCPQCEKIIPCIWNLTSLILLALTSPIWAWFRRPLEAKWHSYKKNQHHKNTDLDPVTAKSTSWLKLGIVYGSLMFCATSLLEVIKGDVTSKYIITQIILWLVAGLAFGGVMKFILGRRKNV
jgi:hypothetical protein